MAQRVDRRGREVAVTLVLLTATACSAIRFGHSVPGVDLSGTYAGAMEVQGQQFSGTLALTQDGTRLTVTFRSPDLNLTADGTGEVGPDGSLTMALDYEIQCPGTTHLRGRWEEGGAHLSGDLIANDCTGEAAGAFDFRRR